MGHNKILEVKELSKKYDEFLLDNVTFGLDSGKIKGLIGPNGSGKSTTMKLILRIVERDYGDVLFNKTSIYICKDMSYKEKVGYVGENTDFFINEKLKDIKTFYKSFYKTWDENYYISIINKFELNDNYKMVELSKGMRMKFSLSLALSHKPKLLLMDEPTSGLDPLVRNEILKILKDYAKENETSILFSSHITEDMFKIADDLLFIYKGKIIGDCPTESLITKGYDIDTYLENLIKAN